MIRKQLYIDDELERDLKALAERTGESEAEHVRRPIAAPLWRIGWPDAAFGVATYGADVLLIALVVTLGTTALAASRPMVTTVAILFVVVFGVSSGISVLVGQRLGARDLDGADGFRRAVTVLMGLLAAIVPLMVAGLGFAGIYVGFASGWAARTAVTWLRYRRRAWAAPDPA